MRKLTPAVVLMMMVLALSFSLQISMAQTTGTPVAPTQAHRCRFSSSPVATSLL
jgi:hypothetical protein